LVLKSRYLFLDTSVLIELNFNYSHVNLKRLVELAEADRAHLVLTSVMIRKVEANIVYRLLQIGLVGNRKTVPTIVRRY
jgi:predicted nucleic acid-binding protein